MYLFSVKMLNISNNKNNKNNLTKRILIISIIILSISFFIMIGAMGTVNADSSLKIVSNSSSSNVEVSVGYYKWKGFNTGADISKVKDFKKYNKKGLLTKVLFNYKDSKGNIKRGIASKGTPIFKFKNSNGPKTMVLSGIHGDEYSSQVATLKLINYLNKNRDKIKGTIYIIPISNPKATLKKTRTFFGYDPNRVAGISKSFTGHIINNIIIKEKIRYIGDFHTMIGGSRLIYAAPYSKSIKISKYLAKKTKAACKLSPNKGTITSTAAKNGIISFTGEVESKKGIASPNRIFWSLKQMITFLKYTKNF